MLGAIGDERERALAYACAWGVLRCYYSLKARLAGLLGRPLRPRDADVEGLLLVGLYQLEHMATPPHAAVSACVDVTRELGKPWASRLVNAVLRKALRESPAVPARESVRYEHPEWLVARIREDWPEDWREILCRGNRQAPMTLRVNCRHSDVDGYLSLLAAAGIAAAKGRHAPAAIVLPEPVPVASLPRFTDGWVSIQDEAAQLAAPLLAPRAGERVLDACAAPGGKTAHLLEIRPSHVDVVALDRSEIRMHRMRENLERLALQCQLVVADAGDPPSWWDGRSFDRILLDSPCSALGIVRRHPDIRIHRRAPDIDRLAAEQRRLLHALWPLLCDGGTLLYVTCSIMRAENDDIVESLFTTCPDAEVEKLSVPWGRITRYGRQILPGEEDMDGFYFARLTKGGRGR